jgi:glycosyltransferase involved in cell wall biosynthesis
VTGSSLPTGTAPHAHQGPPPCNAQRHAAPLVSFIIPTHNYARFLGEAIDSALAQTYPNFELIVVDDGSTDNTPEIVAPLQHRLRYIRQEQSGPSAARNSGIRASRGELIAFLDADDVWLPHKTATQVRYLLEHPETGLVSGRTRLTGDQGKDPPRIGYRRRRALRRLIALRAGVAFRNLLLSDRNYIATSTVMLRRQCLDLVGHFDESLSRVEDFNLWLRVARHFGIARLPEVLAHHRFHESNLARDREAMRSAAFANLDRICAACPEATRLRNRVAARLHLRHGLTDIYERRLTEARYNVVAAIRRYPFYLEAYPLLALSCLPRPLLEVLRAVNRTGRTWLNSSAAWLRRQPSSRRVDVPLRAARKRTRDCG